MKNSDAIMGLLAVIDHQIAQCEHYEATSHESEVIDRAINDGALDAYRHVQSELEKLGYKLGS